MRKSLFAAAIAAVLLPAAVEAAPGVYNPWKWGASYGLACDTSKSGLANGIRLKNPSSVVVPKGTRIDVRVWTDTGFEKFTRIAPHAIGPGQTLMVYQPKGAFRCLAEAWVHRVDPKVIIRR